MSAALTDLLAEYHIDGDEVAAKVRAAVNVADTAPPLSDGERELLSNGGLDMTARSNAGTELTRTLRDAVQVSNAYTAAEVAANNGVQPGRVRAWVSNSDLIVVKVDGRNRYPRFQFDAAGRRIPGLAAATRHKPLQWSWRVWRNFLTTPDPTYAGPDGQPATALDWLAAGGDPETVVAMTRAGW